MNIVRIVINAAEPLLLKTPVILCPRSCCICWKTVLTQKTAIKTGMENLHVTDRTVMNYIKELMKSGLITKAKKGFYEKVKFQTGQATET